MNETIEARTSRRIILRLVVPLMVLQVLNSLDRVNISFAALQMNTDLGLSVELYGHAVSIFFVSYLLFQFPSARALRVFGARWWIFGVVLLWGTAATAMAFVTDLWQLYVLRFLLGVAEAGYAPGVVFLCTSWVPRKYRARAVATTMLAVPVSVVLGAPLSGWLLSMATPFDIAAWRWMLFIEGLPAVVLAFVALKVFQHEPLNASWLSSEEKHWLQEELDSEHKSASSEKLVSFRQVLSDGRILCSAGIWFCLIFGAYGIMFWMPLVLQEMTQLGELAIGLVSALPWLGVGTGMVLISRHSDIKQERFRHVGLAALVGSVALLASAWSPSGAVSLLLLFVFGVGLGGAQATFWTIPTALMSRAVAASGVVFINLIGNVSSLINSSVIGFVREQTGSYLWPVMMLAGMLALAAALVAVIALLSRSSRRGA